MRASRMLPLVFVVAAAACSSQAPASPPPLASGRSSQCPTSDIDRRCLPPVDASIEPISLSHPSRDAAAALDRCLGGRTDVEVVAGGRVAHARDAPQYVPLPPNQVEIQNGDPMWLIQLRGVFQFPTGSPAPPGAGVVHNPLCFVGSADSGYIDVAEADSSGITKSLPTPAP